jgi:hypothetical protein
VRTGLGFLTDFSGMSTAEKGSFFFGDPGRHFELSTYFEDFLPCFFWKFFSGKIDLRKRPVFRKFGAKWLNRLKTPPVQFGPKMTKKNRKEASLERNILGKSGCPTTFRENLWKNKVKKKCPNFPPKIGKK